MLPDHDFVHLAPGFTGTLTRRRSSAEGPSDAPALTAIAGVPVLQIR